MLFVFPIQPSPAESFWFYCETRVGPLVSSLVGMHWHIIGGRLGIGLRRPLGGIQTYLYSAAVAAYLLLLVGCPPPSPWPDLNRPLFWVDVDRRQSQSSLLAVMVSAGNWVGRFVLPMDVLAKGCLYSTCTNIDSTTEFGQVYNYNMSMSFLQGCTSCNRKPTRTIRA